MRPGRYKPRTLRFGDTTVTAVNGEKVLRCRRATGARVRGLVAQSSARGPMYRRGAVALPCHVDRLQADHASLQLPGLRTQLRRLSPVVSSAPDDPL